MPNLWLCGVNSNKTVLCKNKDKYFGGVEDFFHMVFVIQIWIPCMTAMKRTDEKDTWMPEDFEVWKRKAYGR